MGSKQTRSYYSLKLVEALLFLQLGGSSPPENTYLQGLCTPPPTTHTDLSREIVKAMMDWVVRALLPACTFGIAGLHSCLPRAKKYHDRLGTSPFDVGKKAQYL